MTLDLDTRQIHLWCSFFTGIGDERLLKAYRSLLSKAEREHERRFHFLHDQHRYVVTRALVRTVLSRYAHIAAEEWVFAASPYGRPQIANDDVAAKSISFNVTHTDGLIIVAITHHRALGVDTENVHARHVSIDIADHCFAPEEVTALRALPEPRQQQRFFEYWTLKEAYIKARGMGLSIQLDRFSFRFPADETIELSIHPDERDTPSHWRFCQLSLSPNFLVAICAESMEREMPDLVVTRTVPLVSDHQLNYTILRSSTGFEKSASTSTS